MILRTSPHSASRLLTSNSLLNSKLAYGLVVPQKWLTCDSAIALLVVYSKKAGTQRYICKSMFFKKNIKKIFVWLCRDLSCGMGGPSSLTRPWTQVPCIGNSESQSLDHQGSPCMSRVHSSIIHSSQEVEATQVSISVWMDGHTVMFSTMEY